MLKIVLLAITFLNLAHCHFYGKLVFSRVFSKCIGEENYQNYRISYINATKECYWEPIRMIKNGTSAAMDEVMDPMPAMMQEDSVGEYFGMMQHDCPQEEMGEDGMMGTADGMVNDPHMMDMSSVMSGCSAEKHMDNLLIESNFMKVIMMKAAARVSNFTCVLQKMGYVDENLNLKFDTFTEQFQQLTPDVMKNMAFVESVEYCRNLTLCLPEEPRAYMPIEIKRIVTFWRCHKESFTKICMQSHFKELLKIFDMLMMPMMDEDEDEMAETCLGLFWGANAEDFSFY